MAVGFEFAVPLALASASFFGAGKVLDKKGLSGAQLLIGALYTLIVGPPLLLLASVISGDLFNSRNYDLLAIFHSGVGGIFSYTLGTVFLFASIKSIGAARASVLSSTQVIFAPFLSIIFLSENMSLKLAAGTVTIFTGLTLISLSTPHNQEVMSVDRSKFRNGYAFGLIAGFLWGASYPFTRSALVRLGSPVMVSLFSYLFAVPALLLILLCYKSGRRAELNNPSRLFLSGSGTLRVAATLSQSAALALAPVVLIVPFISMSPLITVFLSYLLIQKTEFINRKVFFGTAVVVVGATIIGVFT